MKRLLFVFFILPLLTTCELFDNDMPAFLDFYSGTAKIESHIVDGSHLIGNNKVNISPESDRTITFHLNNPQKYDLNLGINWNDSLLTRTTAEPPVQDTDYTLVQNPNNKSLIRLMFTKEFLYKTDIADNGDISATISLTESKSGREFESYGYSLESNSPPPHPEDTRLMKVGNAGTKYVICFKLPHFTSAPNHKDIRTLMITNNLNGNVIDEYTIAPANGSGDGAVTDDNDNKILPDDTTLSPWRVGEADLPDGYDDNGVGIFYVTDVTVGRSIDYTVTLIDDNGLSSEAVISDELRPTDVAIEVTINEENGTVLHERKYYTKNSDVTLKLSPATGGEVAAYQSTNTRAEPDASTNDWIPWTGKNSIDSPRYTLDQPNDVGLKTIYVWVKDSGGIVSYVAEVKITRTTTAPTIAVAINEEDGTVLSGTTYYTNNNYVTLNLSTEIHASGVAGYTIKNDDTDPPDPPDATSGTWEDWDGKNSTSSPRHTLTKLANRDVNNIYVWVKDNVGNISAMKTVTVTIAKALPIITRVSIGGKFVSHGGVNLDSAPTRDVVITSSPPLDIVAYQITPVASSSSIWQSTASGSSITVKGLPFVHNESIYIQVKDSVGNVSEKYPIVITNSIVYLKPNAPTSNGDGSLNNPVKSVAQARALLGSNNISPTIKLMNTIVINNNPPEWRFGQKVIIVRYGFTGDMILVTESGNLTLENVILDGENKSDTTDSLINNYGILTLSNDAILRNNKNSRGYGGGVANHDGSFTMSGSAVINNNSGNRHGGGGVYVGQESSTFTMSGSAVINNNISPNSGGGVYIFMGDSIGIFKMGSGTVVHGNRPNDIRGYVTPQLNITLM